MRILIILDLHEDLNFLARVQAEQNFDHYDHIVCLSDYFDPRIPSTDAMLEATAKKIRELKLQCGDKLHLIFGNHALPYYALRPDFVEFDTRPNFSIGFSMNCTTLERAKIINRIWADSFWQQLKRGHFIR